MMTAWVALLSAVAGAGIALIGQYTTGRRERGARHAEMVSEQASLVVALCEDFHSRFWDEWALGLNGRVEGWDLAAHRLADARLRILCDDTAMVKALDDLITSGMDLGIYWRRGNTEPEEVERRYSAYKESITRFITVSQRYVRRRS